MRFVKTFIAKHKFFPNPAVLVGSTVLAGHGLGITSLAPDDRVWTAIGIGLVATFALGWEPRDQRR